MLEKVHHSQLGHRPRMEGDDVCRQLVGELEFHRPSSSSSLNIASFVNVFVCYEEAQAGHDDDHHHHRTVVCRTSSI